MDTLILTPDWGAAPTLNQRVKKVQFGNGYKQTSPDGLNAYDETWAISKTDDLSALAPIYAFFKAHVGRSFLWKTPLGDTLQVQADDVKMPNVEANIFTLQATFSQSFEP